MDEHYQKIPESRCCQLLERVTAIYENNFLENPSVKTWFEQHGMIDTSLFAKYRIGFCDGRLNAILPAKGTLREELKAIGIFSDQGNEVFTGCVVVPMIDIKGNVRNLCGIDIGEDDARPIFLESRPKGFWNEAAAKIHDEIIVVDSIFDGLSIAMVGFDNLVAAPCLEELSDNKVMDLKVQGVNKIILIFPGDDHGMEVAEEFKERLHLFSVETRHLPGGHCPKTYLRKYGPEKLAGFIQGKEAASFSLIGPQGIQNDPDGFTATFGLRIYRVMGIEKGPRRLRATIRVEHAGKLHVDTLDFYSARSRRILSQDICRFFKEVPETIESDVTRLIKECETRAEHPGRYLKEDSNPLAVSGKDRDEAEAFGRSPDLIQHILKDFQTCGLIGEEANKLLGYIAMTSRKLATPISVQILSSSGAGKTALQDAVVDFCPPEDLVKLTSLSGKALFYKDQKSLKHKVLALEEGDGAEEAAYAIRSLISSGVLVNETTIKDLSTGKLTTMENRVEGPTAVFYTTTNPDVDPETKSRFFVTGIDESPEQTRKILAFQREQHQRGEVLKSQKAPILKKHRNFQRLLKPYNVKNPFSARLSYGDDRLQSRRDQPKYLNLINAVAFLRQMQKPAEFEVKNGRSEPFIQVDIKDIETANHLAQEILGRSLDELSRQGRNLLMVLDDMVETLWRQKKNTRLKRTDISFTRREIREYSGWAYTRVHRYLTELVNMEYVFSVRSGIGPLYYYHLAYEGQGKDGSKFILGLTPVADLIKDD